MIVAKEIDGNIKVFYKVPEKWDNDIAFYMRDAAYWNSKGFYEVIEVTPSDTQKRGAIYFDNVNNVFTYPLIAKTPEDLAQEASNAKEAKRYEVKQKYLDIIAEDKIALNPADTLLYFKEWVAGSYKIDARVTYKGKPFKNTIEGNINAPDKGGWIEIK